MDIVRGYTTLSVLQSDDRQKMLLLQSKETGKCYVAKIHQDYRYFAHEKGVLERLCGCAGVPPFVGVGETDTHHTVLLTEDTGGRDLGQVLQGGERFEVWMNFDFLFCYLLSLSHHPRSTSSSTLPFLCRAFSATSTPAASSMETSSHVSTSLPFSASFVFFLCFITSPPPLSHFYHFTENVLYNSQTGDVHLIDFCDARVLHTQSRLSDRMSGAPAFSAPEQSGRVHRPVDFRSDVYAMGALFYWTLTGEGPYSGHGVTWPRSIGVLDVVGGHIRGDVPRVRTQRTDVPPQLDRVIHTLLRKDPDDRFQSACGVWMQLLALRKRRRGEGGEGGGDKGEREMSGDIQSDALAERFVCMSQMIRTGNVKSERVSESEKCYLLDQEG